MGLIIVDGKGRGFTVGVNEDNQLQIIATNHTEEHIRTNQGRAFYVNTADTANTLTQTATGGPMLFLRNDDSDRILVIEKVLTSASVAGGIVVWRRNPTLGTIGNNNVHTPVNMNFGSSVTANVTAYNWNEVGNGMTGLSGGTVLKTFITNVGISIHPIDGALVLQRGDSFQLDYFGALNTEFEAGVRFYMDPAGGI